MAQANADAQGCGQVMERLLADPPAEHCGHVTDRVSWFVLADEPGRRICCDCFEDTMKREIRSSAGRWPIIAGCVCCGQLWESDADGYTMLTDGHHGSLVMPLCASCTTVAA